MPRNNPPLNRPAANPNAKRVDVYGTSWCAASQRVRRLLDRLGVRYVYYDMDKDPQAQQRVQWWAGGYPSHPTVHIAGEILVEPSLDELQLALARHAVI
jgi:mycoredoxin